MIRFHRSSCLKARGCDRSSSKGRQNRNLFRLRTSNPGSAALRDEASLIGEILQKIDKTGRFSHCAQERACQVKDDYKFLIPMSLENFSGTQFDLVNSLRNQILSRYTRSPCDADGGSALSKQEQSEVNDLLLELEGPGKAQQPRPLKNPDIFGNYNVAFSSTQRAPKQEGQRKITTISCTAQKARSVM